MKKQMGRADALGIPYVAIIGGDEMTSGTVTVKNMATGEQQRLTLDEAIEMLK